MTTKYVLTITSIPHDLPESPRLKALLKTMLRAFGFRCVEVREERPEHDTAEGGGKTTKG